MNISQEDQKVLKGCVWWTACKKTPFLVKGCIHDKCYYIAITNLKNIWFRKADREIIIQEKSSFNKGLQVDSFEGVLDLLRKPLESYDRQTDYIFELVSDGKSLSFEVKQTMNIYPFHWQFFLNKVKEGESFELLIEDLINPLLGTLKATEMRVNMIKKNFLDLEQEFKKKLNDREKQLYKSKLEDTEDYWKYLVKDMSAENKISEFELSDASNYFFKSYSIQKIKKIEEEEQRQAREREVREKKRKADQITRSVDKDSSKAGGALVDDYVENIDEINKKIEMENKLKKKDEKKSKKVKMSFL